MGFTSYNKFGEVIYSADTLDGYSSEDFMFKTGGTLTGNLTINKAAPYLWLSDTLTGKIGRLAHDHLAFAPDNVNHDWIMTRTGPDVVTLGAGDKIRDTSDPLTGNDLARKFYVDSVLDAHVTDTGDAHDASAISYAGGTGISATNVEGAIDELASEKADTTYVNSQIVSATEASMPTGAILDFAGATAPTGFLICDGTAVSRTTYADLFAVLSTTYGPGDGATTFDLPDFRGRVSVGAGSGVGENASGAAGTAPAGAALTARARGSWAGGEFVALTAAQTPLRTHTHGGTTADINQNHYHSGATDSDNIDHGHSGTTGGRSAFHQHNVTHTSISNTGVDGNGTRVTVLQGGTVNYTTGNDNTEHVHGFSTGGRSAFHQHGFTTGWVSGGHTHGFTTGNPSVAEANGSNHNNVQPFLTVNKIIKT